MVALVLVSHSRALALALKESLEKLYAGKVPPVAVAAGAGDDGAELGTDATAIMAAIEEVSAAATGVLVLLDLGSAVLSAEMALELLDESVRGKVVLCAAPLVEGAIAAAAQSSIGAPLAAVRAEAEDALRQKIEHLGAASTIDTTPSALPIAPAETTFSGPSIATTLRVDNPHGLHARPAMRIVQTVALFSSTVQIENLRTGKPAIPARSLVAINCLDAREGDLIRVTARGTDAAGAIHALQTLHASQFGDLLKEAKQPPDKSAKPEPLNGASSVDAADDRRLHGKPLSEGVALGTLFFVPRETPSLPPPVTATDTRAELARLNGALASVRQQLAESAAALSASLGWENAAIFQAHEMLLGDPLLIEPAVAFVQDERLPAAHAWHKASQLAAEAYRNLEQPLLRERARDVEDLSLRVLRELGVGASLRLDLPDNPCVLAVPTLLPSEVVALDLRKVRGIIAEAIGFTNHAAILLRAAGVAAVDGMDLTRLREAAGVAGNLMVALDGGTGEVWLAPNAATTQEIAARRQREDSAMPPAGDVTPALLRTRDGRRVELAANVASAADAVAAARAGAEAIGLLRTEFLFFDRAEPPGEDEQTETLQCIAAALPPDAPVTVRTFDIGGDKPVPSLPMPPELNPFLGVRGLRLALKNCPVFLAHLRAILRAGEGRRFRVMFPMVTEVEEIRCARALLEMAHEELSRTGTAHAWPVEVGMMIEVPAAALNAHNFVSEVDFFSIGTNDLTQYTLAAERGHAQLAGFADALHPAVLRLVWRVAAIAARNHKWAGVCGEAAADPVAAGVFIGLGLQELSVGAAVLRRLRQTVVAADYAQNRKRARQCLKAASSEEVRRLWLE